MMCDPEFEPFRYIDSLKTKKHIALFYEDAEYARMIEFRFLRNGLMAGEQCIYATDDDTGEVILKMLEYGIPLEYLQSKKLRVYQIHPRTGSHDEMLSECKKDIVTIFSDMVKPFRIVGRMIPDVSTLKGMVVEIELESSAHKIFEDFGGYIMCPYDLSKMEKSKSKEWMTGLMQSHHAVIYAPRFGEGGVFYASE
jgi:MEDS: MEthanogen/methylotroph, DcmR Sensory domain